MAVSSEENGIVGLGAAHALQSSEKLAEIDSELARTIDAWPTFLESAREEIVALVQWSADSR